MEVNMTETNTTARARDDILVDQVRRSLRGVSGAMMVPDPEWYGPAAVEFADSQEAAIDQEVEKFRALLADTEEVAA